MSKLADQDDHFQTENLEDDLRGRSVRGGAITLTAQGCKFALSLVSIAILARLLTPSDFGLIAMVVALTGFMDRFKDLGLSMSTVQRAEINHRQISTLFWINVGIGILVTLLAVALAPAVAWFYGDPRLIKVTLVLSCVFIFGGLTVQHQALLRRQMRFATLATVEIASMLASITVGIISAFLLGNYWALVFMQLTAAVTMMLGVWVRCSWRPGRPAVATGIRSMLAFGGALSAANLLNFIVRNLDNVLIGWYWGPKAVGLYSKAYSLLLLPLQQINAPITSVAIPTLSRLQNDPARYQLYYYKAIHFLVLIGIPIVAFMFVSADLIVELILGNQWTDAVPIFRLLVPAAFIGTFNVATGWIYVSLGHTLRQLYWEIVSTIIIALGFSIGLGWGTMGVAAACSITFCCLRIPAMSYCFRPTPIRVMKVLELLWRPTIAASLSALLIFIIDGLMGQSVLLSIHTLIDLFIFFATYLIVIRMMPKGRYIYREIISLLKDLRPV